MQVELWVDLVRTPNLPDAVVKTSQHSLAYLANDAAIHLAHKQNLHRLKPWHLKQFNANRIATSPKLAKHAATTKLRRVANTGGAFLAFNLNMEQDFTVSIILHLLDELDLLNVEPKLDVSVLRVEPTLGRGGGGGVSETLYDALATFTSRRRPLLMPGTAATARPVRTAEDAATLLRDAMADAPDDSYAIVKLEVSNKKEWTQCVGAASDLPEFKVVLLPSPGKLTTGAAAASFGDLAFAIRSRVALSNPARQSDNINAVNHAHHYGTSKIATLLRCSPQAELIFSLRLFASTCMARESRTAIDLAIRFCGKCLIPRAAAYHSPASDPLSAFLNTGDENDLGHTFEKRGLKSSIGRLMNSTSEASLTIAIQAERTAVVETVADSSERRLNLESSAASCSTYKLNEAGLYSSSPHQTAAAQRDSPRHSLLAAARVKPKIYAKSNVAKGNPRQHHNVSANQNRVWAPREAISQGERQHSKKGLAVDPSYVARVNAEARMQKGHLATVKAAPECSVDNSYVARVTAEARLMKGRSSAANKCDSASKVLDKNSKGVGAAHLRCEANMGASFNDDSEARITASEDALIDEVDALTNRLIRESVQGRLRETEITAKANHHIDLVQQAQKISMDRIAAQMQSQVDEQTQNAQYWHGVVESLVDTQRKSALLRGLMMREALRLRCAWMSWISLPVHYRFSAAS